MATALRRYYRGHNLVTLREVPTAQSRVYHFDPQGTTQCLTDSTGTVTDRFAADAWGVPVKRTGSSLNRQWYVGNGGYSRDTPTSALYVRARWLVPARAAWWSRETPVIELVYGYVRNRPVLFVDPSGLYSERCVGDPPVRDECEEEVNSNLLKWKKSCQAQGGSWQKCNPVPVGDPDPCDPSRKPDCAAIMKSLRAAASDCRQGCDWFLSPPPNKKEFYNPDAAQIQVLTICLPGIKLCDFYCCEPAYSKLPDCLRYCLNRHEYFHKDTVCSPSYDPPLSVKYCLDRLKALASGNRPDYPEEIQDLRNRLSFFAECIAYQAQARCLYNAALKNKCASVTALNEILSQCNRSVDRMRTSDKGCRKGMGR